MLFCYCATLALALTSEPCNLHLESLPENPCKMQNLSSGQLALKGSDPKGWSLNRGISLTFGSERKACLASAAFVLFLCVFEGLYLRCGLITLIEWLRQGNDITNLLLAAF